MGDKSLGEGDETFSNNSLEFIWNPNNSEIIVKNDVDMWVQFVKVFLDYQAPSGRNVSKFLVNLIDKCDFEWVVL